MKSISAKQGVRPGDLRHAKQQSEQIAALGIMIRKSNYEGKREPAKTTLTTDAPCHYVFLARSDVLACGHIRKEF